MAYHPYKRAPRHTKARQPWLVTIEPDWFNKPENDEDITDPDELGFDALKRIFGKLLMLSKELVRDPAKIKEIIKNGSVVLGRTDFIIESDDKTVEALNDYLFEATSRVQKIAKQTEKSLGLKPSILIDALVTSGEPLEIRAESLESTDSDSDYE